jgi:hypothetical protein
LSFLEHSHPTIKRVIAFTLTYPIGSLEHRRSDSAAMDVGNIGGEKEKHDGL